MTAGRRMSCSREDRVRRSRRRRHSGTTTEQKSAPRTVVTFVVTLSIRRTYPDTAAHILLSKSKCFIVWVITESGGFARSEDLVLQAGGRRFDPGHVHQDFTPLDSVA